jgi:hypothetical protein
MTRSTKTQKALNLNAAHGLLSRGISVAEAATILAQERGISRRQAYRYLEHARTITHVVPIGEASVAATFQAEATARIRTLHPDEAASILI